MSNKKILALFGIIGIVAISSFSIGYITSIVINTPIDDTPKLYIATDDTYLYGIGNDDKPQGNETFIMAGRRVVVTLYLNSSFKDNHRISL